MNLKRRLATATAAGLLAATATACATHHHVVAVQQPAAASVVGPAAYGQNGQCYYLDDPQEALNLIAAGLCQPGWRPTVMPLDWHYTYADYYASPAYLTYVPLSYRSGWANQWGTKSTFYTTNITIIHNKEKTATYKGSDGKPITGNVTNFATPKAPSSTSAPLPVGARSSAPLPVGGARSTAQNTAPAPAPSTKPLPGGGARVVTPPKVSAR